MIKGALLSRRGGGWRCWPKRQRGGSSVEFAVVGPIVLFLGLGAIQYVMMFNAKNINNHAAFMAARAGSMANANITSVVNAYAHALIPMYGGGSNSEDLARSLAKATEDIARYSKIQIMNPTKESFDDWNNANLEKVNNVRTIPNGSQAVASPDTIGAKSGQNIQDANVLKLRMTYGYELKVPLVSTLVKSLMQASDDKMDPFVTYLYHENRVPVMVDVAVQMQSNAQEGKTVSEPAPDKGSTGGDNTDTAQPEPEKPGECESAGCGNSGKTPPSEPPSCKASA